VGSEKYFILISDTIKDTIELGTVVHACNPRKRLRQEDHLKFKVGLSYSPFFKTKQQ
jgi:hypothetical protein